MAPEISIFQAFVQRWAGNRFSDDTTLCIFFCLKIFQWKLIFNTTFMPAFISFLGSFSGSKVIEKISHFFNKLNIAPYLIIGTIFVANPEIFIKPAKREYQSSLEKLKRKEAQVKKILDENFLLRVRISLELRSFEFVETLLQLPEILLVEMNRSQLQISKAIADYDTQIMLQRAMYLYTLTMLLISLFFLYYNKIILIPSILPRNFFVVILAISVVSATLSFFIHIINRIFKITYYLVIIPGVLFDFLVIRPIALMLKFHIPLISWVSGCLTIFLLIIVFLTVP